MNSRLMETDNILRAAMMKTVRHTFFEHFCAGEDVVEAGRCIKKVNESGLRGMLVFAVEYTGDNDACDQNLKGFLDTVQSAMSLPPSSVRFRFSLNFIPFLFINLILLPFFQFFEPLISSY